MFFGSKTGPGGNVLSSRVPLLLEDSPLTLSYLTVASTGEQVNTACRAPAPGAAAERDHLSAWARGLLRYLFLGSFHI